MNSKSTMGIILIVLGILALVFQGITYKKREKVLDIGPLQATAEKTETVPIYPVVGGLLLAGGVALLIFSNKRPTS
jgi:hypothetical protein